MMEKNSIVKIEMEKKSIYTMLSRGHLAAFNRSEI